MLTASHAEKSSHTNHLAALRRRHEEIGEKLEYAKSAPSISDFYLAELKRQKLQLKDEIERLAVGSAGEA